MGVGRAPGCDTGVMTINATADRDDTLLSRVESVIDVIRPAIQADGGDVHLVDITTEGVVQVRFEGECLRCPSRDMTLRSGIETTIRNRLQNIAGVEEVQN